MSSLELSSSACLPVERPHAGEEGTAGAVVVRATDRPARMSAWTLVLMAHGLEGWVVQDGARLVLCVPAAQSVRAQAELAAADAEDREHARDEARALRALTPTAASPHPWLVAVLMGVLLIAFHFVTGTRSEGAMWFARGASDATRVLHGEAYRAITALTLHADSAHVLSNVGFGTLVLGAVLRSTGVGMGSLLVVGAGTLGNLANAAVHGSHHSSVGFSTAVFAAIGLLGALRYTEARRQPARKRTAWTMLATSVALLAALGASEKSDVLAHLFGGLMGTGLGLAVGFTPLRALRSPLQWLAGATTTGVVVGAWWVALQV